MFSTQYVSEVTVKRKSEVKHALMILGHVSLSRTHIHCLWQWQAHLNPGELTRIAPSSASCLRCNPNHLKHRISEHLDTFALNHEFDMAIIISFHIREPGPNCPPAPPSPTQPRPLVSPFQVEGLAGLVAKTRKSREE